MGLIGASWRVFRAQYRLGDDPNPDEQMALNGDPGASAARHHADPFNLETAVDRFPPPATPHEH
jgi:hypothetical protein